MRSVGRTLLLISSALVLALLVLRTIVHFTGIGARTITTVTAQGSTVRHVPAAILSGPALGIVAVFGLIAGTWLAWTLGARLSHRG